MANPNLTLKHEKNSKIKARSRMGPAYRTTDFKHTLTWAYDVGFRLTIYCSKALDVRNAATALELFFQPFFYFKNHRL